MQLLWTWSGLFFGYREEDNLFSHQGKHIGKFFGNEIYSDAGIYLGEIMIERLITCKSKKTYRKFGFSPYSPRVPLLKYTNYVGYVMYLGYEDFSEH